MKLACFFVLLLFVSALAAMEDDTDSKCERILGIVGDIEPQAIQMLYAYKRETRSRWRKSDAYAVRISYILEPKDMVRYEFSWKIANHQRREDILNDGSLACEIPASWQLSLGAPTTIVFPTIAHGQTQDLPLHAVSTFAGIYLAKSKFPTIEPDHLRVLWHLKKNDIPTNFAAETLADYKFISDNVLVLIEDVLDKRNDVQLVALHVSNKEDVLKGNQYWLVSNADAHQAIINGIYETPLSRHNSWLPWFRLERQEWKSKTPLEAYEATILAGTDNAFVFNRNLGQFLPEPVLGQNRSQTVYDAFAPSVYAIIDGLEPLFAHFVLKQPHNYKFLTFEISRNGEFELRKQASIRDPMQLGLPSAKELGFGLAIDVGQ